MDTARVSYASSVKKKQNDQLYCQFMHPAIDSNVDEFLTHWEKSFNAIKTIEMNGETTVRILFKLILVSYIVYFCNKLSHEHIDTKIELLIVSFAKIKSIIRMSEAIAGTESMCL